MNFFCPAGIFCDPSEFPVTNFSSEDPDFESFLANFIINNRPPLGRTWNHAWCYGQCQSDISQQDADLCAERNAIVCTTIDPPDPNGGDGGGGDGGDASGGGPEVPPTNPGNPLFGNDPQTASRQCPDGGEAFTHTVPAGTFLNRSLSIANAAALQLATQKVNEQFLCVPDFSADQCLGDLLNDTVTITGQNPPFQISVSGGPPGMEFTVIDAATVLISGTLTQAGNYTATVTVTDAKGTTRSRQAQIVVLGITNCPLPDATPNQAYSAQLNAEGGTGPYTFVTDPVTMPAWLTISSSGAASGTPQNSDADIDFAFDVIVQDSAGHECTQHCDVFVTGLCPDNGTECTPYSYQMTPASGTWSIGGLPGGLTCSASGHITGTPSVKGSFPISINHTDTLGHLRHWNCTIAIATDGDTCPRSVEDIGPWSLVTDLGIGSLTGTTPNNGDASFQLKFTSGTNPAGTRKTWNAVVTRCASIAAYPLQWTIDIQFDRGSDTHLNWSIGFNVLGSGYSKINQTISDSDSGTTAGNVPTGSGCNPVASPNLVLDVQLSSSGAISNDCTLVVTITLRPLTPP